MLLFSVAILALGAGYVVLDHRVRRQEAERAAPPRAAYSCQECGRRVEYRSTVRPIRLTLLCPEDYHRRYGALAPAPTPEMERRAHRGHRGAGPRPPMSLLPRR